MAIFSKFFTAAVALATFTSASPVTNHRGKGRGHGHGKVVYTTVTETEWVTLTTTITVPPGETAPAPTTFVQEPAVTPSSSALPAPETNSPPAQTEDPAPPQTEEPQSTQSQNSPPSPPPPAPTEVPETTQTQNNPPPAQTSPVTPPPQKGNEDGGSSGGSPSADVKTGDGTFYDTAELKTNPSYCGTINKGAEEDVVALSQAIMNESLCGKTISVSYDGNPPVQAKVVDMCPGCSATSIDMSRHLFAAIGAHEDLGRITVDWWFEN